MKLSKEEKRVWESWLSERPDSVKKVAERIVPWKKYRDKRVEEDLGNRYRPIFYDESEDGTVTLTCEKTNEEMPVLGGYNVFGMNPDNLIEE